MDSKFAAKYDEFEPLCNWQREEGRDTLVLHLPEFKKEQLKVQLSNLRVLKISGERPLSAVKQSRFYKEVKVAKECNANDIRAKFVNGLLYVVMPKTIPVVQEHEEAPLGHEQVQDNKQPNGGTGPDDHHPSAEEKILSSQQGCCIPSPSYSSMRMKLALVIAVACAVGGYLFYRYNILSDGELGNAI
ncbi:hypothetical protein ACET3Z_009238 [Daucus carota]